MQNETSAQPASTPNDSAWTTQIFDPASPGDFVEGWHEKLPPELADYRGIAAGAHSVRDLLHRIKTSVQAARDKAGLKPLPADATEDQKSRWNEDLRAMLGVPNDPKGYELQPPGGGLPWDESENGYIHAAHQLGLTKAQAAGLMQWYETRHNEGMAAHTAAQREAAAKEIAELEKTYGPRLSSAVELAQRAAHGEGWPPEVFDPRHERFIGFEAFKLVHTLAARLHQASASDPFPDATALKTDPAGLDYARAVMSGTHPDSAAWRKGDRAIQTRIDAAYERAYTG